VVEERQSIPRKAKPCAFLRDFVLLHEASTLQRRPAMGALAPRGMGTRMFPQFFGK
jgi:hypothetical protein